MDDRPVTHEIAAPRTSVEKLRDGLASLQAMEPEDPGHAAQLAMIGGALPFLAPLFPDDPAELDVILLAAAKWALSLRSDDAWHPEQLDELFGLGEEPAA